MEKTQTGTFVIFDVQSPTKPKQPYLLLTNTGIIFRTWAKEIVDELKEFPITAEVEYRIQSFKDVPDYIIVSFNVIEKEDRYKKVIDECVRQTLEVMKDNELYLNAMRIDSTRAFTTIFGTLAIQKLRDTSGRK